MPAVARMMPRDFSSRSELGVMAGWFEKFGGRRALVLLVAIMLPFAAIKLGGEAGHATYWIVGLACGAAWIAIFAATLQPRDFNWWWAALAFFVGFFLINQVFLIALRLPLSVTLQQWKVSTEFPENVVPTFLATCVPEELVVLVPLILLVWFRPTSTTVFCGIVVGLGFSFAESISALNGYNRGLATPTDGLANGILRLTTIPALQGVRSGLGAAFLVLMMRSGSWSGKVLLGAAALLVPALFHLGHNTLLYVGQPVRVVVNALSVILLLALYRPIRAGDDARRVSLGRCE